MSRKPSNVNKRTIQWGAKVHTINTVDTANFESAGAAGGTTSSSSSFSSSSSSSFKIQHIPTPPDEDHAASLLRRIQSEFTLIVEKRGYILTSVTEMCCCEDGLDHMNMNPGSGSGNNGNAATTTKKRGRKTRRMPNNVLGYNLSHGTRNGNSVHRIHLRLRHPTKHTFYPYEDIAGTMCHELAHCERGPHDAKFYKLMDEIMEQYAVFMVKGLVVDTSGFPMDSSNARVLGGAQGGNGNTRSHAEKAAQNRQRQQRMGGTFVLGGGGGNMSGAKSASSLAHLPPAEAARRAAERRIEERQRNDSNFCLPCRDIIEILDGSSSDEEEDEEKVGVQDVDGKKQKSFKAPQNMKPKKIKTRSIILIDGDSSPDDDDSPQKHPASSMPKKRPARKNQASSKPDNVSSLIKTEQEDQTEASDSSDIECSSWTCSKCTYNNKPISLTCDICGHEQNGKQNKRAIEKVLRDDAIEEVKQKEVEKSKQQYGGFNIYGNDKRGSRTLDHIT